METIKRIDHWQLALHDFIDSKRNVVFSYDSSIGTDCATFVCDAILAMTGTDIAAEFRGKYTTQVGALKVIKQVTGGSTVEDVADHVTDQYGIAVLDNHLFAQRGDVVLFDGAEGPALGIVYLDGKNAVFVGDKGLSKLPVRQCRRAWRIG
jgi:hypothetical protein